MYSKDGNKLGGVLGPYRVGETVLITCDVNGGRLEGKYLKWSRV